MPQKSIYFTNMFSQPTFRCRMRMWFGMKVKWKEKCHMSRDVMQDEMALAKPRMGMTL